MDSSEAVTLYLKLYPGCNGVAFDSRYGHSSSRMRAHVRQLLEEAQRVPVEQLGAVDIGAVGDYVETVMRARHPDLTDQALGAIGNYYTYLMR